MSATFTFNNAVSWVALAAALVLSSCQKEELMENQFQEDTSADFHQTGQVIEGQYIVVFKNVNDVSLSSTSAVSASNKIILSSARESALIAAGIKQEEVVESFNGVVNGFAARLSAEQVNKLMTDPHVAYMEKDRYIMLRNERLRDLLLNKFGKNKGSGTKDTTPEPAPAPEPTPTPTEPAPSQPAPAPAPAEPEPTQPAPSSPVTTTAPGAYTSITPVSGEYLPWNIERVGYGDGTGKTVWIIDSGVDTDHPDLNVDMSRSASFIYGNKSVEDGFGHGTSVAGIIGARNNGTGMIGVAANATIVALRVFDDAGQGTVSRAISAVNHASIYAKPGDVINLSLGSGISSTLDNAVKAAAAKGILFAIAAGNTGVDCSGSSPARVDAAGVYTVSAMDSYNRLWASSNYGASVDFSAPGVNVTVTTKGGNIGGGANGTSFAAPHVAGILLLRGTVLAQGAITGDKDDLPDPIASVK